MITVVSGLIVNEPMSDPSDTNEDMDYEIYLDKTNGFWAWMGSVDGIVIVLSLGHNSKHAAQQHLKKHRNQL